MTDLTDFKNFVTVLSNTTVYKNWAKANSGDASRWKTFSSSLIAGQTPPPPTMSTGFGKALIIAGAMAVNTATGSSVYGEAEYGISDF